MKSLPEERELRRLLDILGQVPSYNAGRRYNPRTVIRAVNALLPLGKDKALATIEEFLRVTGFWEHNEGEGMFLVLRTLFDVPKDPGYMPPMMVGRHPQRSPRITSCFLASPLPSKAIFRFWWSRAIIWGDRQRGRRGT